MGFYFLMNLIVPSPPLPTGRQANPPLEGEGKFFEISQERLEINSQT
jgi:hypothetical protein